MRQRLGILALLVCSSLLARPAPAADPPTSPGPPQPPRPPAAQAPAPSTTAPEKQVLRLSLREALARAIENNLDLQIERHAPLIAEETAEQAWGAFDPEGFADFGMSVVQTPRADPFEGIRSVEERKKDGSTGLRGLVPRLGASYELRYQGQGIETDSVLSSLSPEFRTNVLATLRIPLLRDLWWNEPWLRVRVSRIGEAAAREEFRRRLMDTVRDVEDAYWALIAAEGQREVARKSLETAKALLEQTRAQLEAGVVSRVEVTEAEAGVAAREVTLIQAENLYRAAEDRLIDLVLGTQLTATSSLEIVPTDRPGEIKVREVNLELARERAFKNRPELAAARREVERRQAELAFARNQRLPRLDLVGSYGLLGLSGANNPKRLKFPGLPETPLAPPRDYLDADNSFFSPSQSQQWSIRGIVSVPIGNVAARHGVAKAELELRQARTRLRRLEQAIILELRDAARNLHTAVEGIEAADRAYAAAKEQLRAERVRLEHGESTPFNVLLRERDLAEAESQKIAALRAYRSSLTAVDRAQGTILKNRNIVVEEAGRLR